VGTLKDLITAGATLTELEISAISVQVIFLML